MDQWTNGPMDQMWWGESMDDPCTRQRWRMAPGGIRRRARRRSRASPSSNPWTREESFKNKIKNGRVRVESGKVSGVHSTDRQRRAHEARAPHDPPVVVAPLGALVFTCTVCMELLNGNIQLITRCDECGKSSAAAELHGGFSHRRKDGKEKVSL